ncbi:MAG TPA: hypothetical protein VJK50_02165, partial [Patescibacteria group bacterium]|nr:hypothetical protein [Patescibacteria group bacterium]
MTSSKQYVLMCGVLSLLVLLMIFGGAPAIIAEVRQDQNETKAIESITEQDLREALELVAHNQLRGRGTADGGYEFPSLFLARELRKLGIAPSGEVKNSYFQEFEFGKTKKYASRNVIGLIPGVNTDEYVVIGAH